MKEMKIKKHLFVIHETGLKKNWKKKKILLNSYTFANYIAGIRKGYVKTNTKLYEYEFGRT